MTGAREDGADEAEAEAETAADEDDWEVSGDESRESTKFGAVIVGIVC